jgi:hypothetical protein
MIILLALQRRNMFCPKPPLVISLPPPTLPLASNAFLHVSTGEDLCGTSDTDYAFLPLLRSA